jgi:hypothetical protein
MFQVVDPFPERKYQIRKLHIVKQTTLVRVCSLQVIAEHHGAISAENIGEQMDVELLQWCGDRLRDALQTLSTWTLEPGVVSLELRPVSVVSGGRPVPSLRPPPMLDECDSVLALIAADRPKFSCLELEPVPDSGTAIVATHSGVSGSGGTVVKALVEAKAFCENDKFVDASTLAVDAAVITEMCALDLVTTRTSEVGIPQVALNLSRVSVGASLFCSNPVPFLSAARRDVAFHKLSKLELVQHLLQSRFKPSSNPAAALLRTARNGVFWDEGVYKTKNYLLALCLSPLIFQKEGRLPGILHRGCNAYYKCLIALTDMAPLAEKSYPELLALSDKDFGNMLKDGEDPTHHPFIENGDEEEHLAIEDAPGNAPGIVHQIPIQQAASAMSEDAIACKVPGFRPMRVCFDNYSHASGNRRAFTYCSLHDACRLYVFLKDFPTKERAVAFLMAWHHVGTNYKSRNQAKEHIGFKPGDSAVDLVEAEQFC